MVDTCLQKNLMLNQSQSSKQRLTQMLWACKCRSLQDHGANTSSRECGRHTLKKSDYAKDYKMKADIIKTSDAQWWTPYSSGPTGTWIRSWRRLISVLCIV
jgi:hypothetical protein